MLLHFITPTAPKIICELCRRHCPKQLWDKADNYDYSYRVDAYERSPSMWRERDKAHRVECLVRGENVTRLIVFNA